MEQSLEEMRRARHGSKSMTNDIIIDDPNRALTGEPYRHRMQQQALERDQQHHYETQKEEQENLVSVACENNNVLFSQTKSKNKRTWFLLRVKIIMSSFPKITRVMMTMMIGSLMMMMTMTKMPSWRVSVKRVWKNSSDNK
jgi:hypothetical protein